MRAEYLLVLAACVLITLPLEFVLGARVYRRPKRLLIALLPVVVVFYVWDAIAISRGHWSYDPARTTGILLPGAMPLEELAFFLVIPLCGLLTYEAVGNVLRRTRGARAPAERDRAGEQHA
ncbi:MAG TPA: lycopene cyclase domain-containing protein [Propionicimonas sp.]|nr:lycopene cyclase domain-containing protein [Propionicimonas sp.]HRA07429.1 lycopene cyclase domain-containing protein [Propionicimonas sp.]